MLADDEIQGLLDAEIAASIGYADSELSQERIDNLKAFLGEQYGNEREGYSKVISTDVMNTVEWIMPSLMRVFTSGDRVVNFEPEEQNDEKYCEDASEYCDYVVARDNPWFLIASTWFKDALISKNGIIKSWWEVETQQRRAKYKGLDEGAWALLAQEIEGGDVELKEYQEYPAPPHIVAVAPEAQGQIFRDATVMRSKEYGCIKIANVPPEEFLLSRDAIKLDEVRFQGHRTKKTLSWLIEQGYDRETVMDLSSDAASVLGANDEESLLRADTTDQAGSSAPALSLANKAMREVWVIDAYMRCDRDEDGIAEMVHIVAAGTGWNILEVEHWDGPTPFDDIKPSIVPHRWSGLCPADMIKDLQKIQTTIFRQYLDALYLGNNPRYEVDVTNIVDPDDLLQSKPGTNIRKNGPNQAVFPVLTNDVSASALAGMEMVNGAIENRTGVTKYNQGLDANSLNKTASGISQIMGAAQQRIELIARCFAETGVKSLFKKVLYLAVRHADQSRAIKLRGKWVTFNPTEWNDQMDAAINTGIGTGTREMTLQHLMLMGQMQEKIVALQGGAQGPLVDWDVIYKTMSKMSENAGFVNVNTFVKDPTDFQPPPPQPSPEQQKLELEKQKMQMQAQADQQKQQSDMAVKQAEMQMDAQRQQQEMQLEREKAALAVQLEREKAQAQMEIEAMKARHSMQIEREKADHQAEIAAATFAAKERAGAFKPKQPNA